MKRVLVLSYKNLNQETSGGIKRVNALLRSLGERVVLVQPGPAHSQYETWSLPWDWGQRKLGINWGIFNYYWPANMQVVRQVLAKYEFSAAVLTAIGCYHALRGSQLPLFLDLHDVNALAIGERFGAGHVFSQLVQRWEGQAVRAARHIFVCSDNDCATLRSMYGLAVDGVSVVPNGVDLGGATGRLPAHLAAELAGKLVLFFMGKLDYQPNRVALDFMAAEVVPALDRLMAGRYKILVCGGPRLQRSYPEAMLLTGMLSKEELAGCLARADICLAPLFSGSGTRLKILEYWAAGKPVVTTAKGAEGLAYTAGQDLLLAERSEFAQRIVALAADAPFMKKLGAAGYELVQRKYDWQAIMPLWQRVICGKF